MRMSLRKSFYKNQEEVLESVKLKELMHDLKMLESDYYLKGQTDAVTSCSQSAERAFILSRQLGHEEIQLSKRWKVAHECYMCDRWRYTCIFWNSETGAKF